MTRRNLTSLGRTFAPELMSQLDQLDQLINAARGLALKVNETRTALETLYTGDYRNHGYRKPRRRPPSRWTMRAPRFSPPCSCRRSDRATQE
jgi:hypothetical protein